MKSAHLRKLALFVRHRQRRSLKSDANPVDVAVIASTDHLTLGVSGMPRPTLLVAEPEPDQALSVRKLVLETGKFNVITAHSTREAIDLFHLFPNISAAIVTGDLDCERISKTIKSVTDKVPVVFLSAKIGAHSSFADHTLSSHQPDELLSTMRTLFGDPRQMESLNNER